MLAVKLLLSSETETINSNVRQGERDPLCSSRSTLSTLVSFYGTIVKKARFNR